MGQGAERGLQRAKDRGLCGRHAACRGRFGRKIEEQVFVRTQPERRA